MSRVQLKQRAFQITFTNHSWDQLRERGEELPKISAKDLRRKIHGLVNDKAGAGLRFDRDFRCKIEIFKEFYAVLVVSDTGFSVVTYVWDSRKKEAV